MLIKFFFLIKRKISCSFAQNFYNAALKLFMSETAIVDWLQALQANYKHLFTDCLLKCWK